MTKTSIFSVMDDLSMLSEIPNADINKNKLSFCPECWSIPQITIDNKNKLIKSNCIKNKAHNSEFSISEYLLKCNSNKKSNVSCLICNQTTQNNFQENNFLKFNDKKNNFISFANQLQYCNECDSFFCYKCSNIHLSQQKKHHLLPMMKIENFCILHNITNSSYCLTCKKNLCLKCLGQHEFHDIIALADIFPFEPEITKKKLALNRQRKELLKVQMIFKEAMNNIYMKFNKLYEKKVDEIEFKDSIIYTFERKPNNYNSINNFKNLEIDFEVFNYNFFSPNGEGKNDIMDDSIGVQKVIKIYEFLESKTSNKKTKQKNNVKNLKANFKNKNSLSANSNKLNNKQSPNSIFKNIGQPSKFSIDSANSAKIKRISKNQNSTYYDSCSDSNLSKSTSVKIIKNSIGEKQKKKNFKKIEIKQKKNAKNKDQKDNEIINNSNEELYISDKKLANSSNSNNSFRKSLQKMSKFQNNNINIRKIKDIEMPDNKHNSSYESSQNINNLSSNISPKINKDIKKINKSLKISYIRDNQKEIMNMILLKDGNFATSSWDTTVKIFNGKTFEILLIIEEPEENDVCYVTQLNDNSILLCSRKIYKYKLFNNDTKYILEYIFHEYNDYIIKAIELKNNTIISCDWEYNIKIWEKIDENRSKYKLVKSNLNSGEHLCSINKINDYEFIASSNSHLEQGKDILRFFDSNYQNIYTIYKISCSELVDSLCQINNQFLCVALQRWNENQLKGIAIIDLYKKQVIKNILSDAMTCICKINDENFLTGGRDYTKKSMMRKWYISKNGDIKQIYEVCTEQTDAITSIIILNDNSILSSNYDSTIAVIQ